MGPDSCGNFEAFLLGTTTKYLDKKDNRNENRSFSFRWNFTRHRVFWNWVDESIRGILWFNVINDWTSNFRSRANFIRISICNFHWSRYILSPSFSFFLFSFQFNDARRAINIIVIILNGRLFLTTVATFAVTCRELCSYRPHWFLSPHSPLRSRYFDFIRRNFSYVTRATFRKTFANCFEQLVEKFQLYRPAGGEIIQR